MWRRIDLPLVNLALYLAVLLLITLFQRELGWAGAQLRGYVEGSIVYPAEQQLCLQARSIVLAGRDLAPARELLERSLSIDPYGEAGYWLGRYFFERGELERALQQFTRTIEVDPSRLDAYLKLSALHERRGEAQAALRVLQGGLAYFEEQATQLVPRPDPTQAAKYNGKAVAVHDRCLGSIITLRREIARMIQGAP